jgi:hypothetical protein
MALPAYFDLPLSVLLVRVEGGPDRERTPRLVGALRTAVLTTLPTPSELAVALQNTDLGGPSALERRLQKVLPNAEISLANRAMRSPACSNAPAAREAARRPRPGRAPATGNECVVAPGDESV